MSAGSRTPPPQPTPTTNDPANCGALTVVPVKVTACTCWTSPFGGCCWLVETAYAILLPSCDHAPGNRGVRPVATCTGACPEMATYSVSLIRSVNSSLVPS